MEGGNSNPPGAEPGLLAAGAVAAPGMAKLELLDAVADEGLGMANSVLLVAVFMPGSALEPGKPELLGATLDVA